MVYNHLGHSRVDISQGNTFLNIYLQFCSNRLSEILRIIIRNRSEIVELFHREIKTVCAAVLTMKNKSHAMFACENRVFPSTNCI